MPDPNPTDGELAILRVLWSLDAPTTVREAYTTVLKILTIMHEKGLVHRDESERSHRYVASYAEPVVQASMLKDFVRRAFGGSASKLVQRALDDDTASSDDLDAIARMIAAAKARKKRR